MYQWRKGIASWQVKKTLYLSVPFTWLVPEAEHLARLHSGPVIAGGPGIDLIGAGKDSLRWADEPGDCPFDTLALHNPFATVTSRGCPNRCPFCAVPIIEGSFRQLETWKRAPVVCDNNILASTERHFERVIDSLTDFPLVDFNQGLDVGLFKGSHVTQLARLRGVIIRFAFDDVDKETELANAITRARNRGFLNKDIRVYALIGWQDTPDNARYRLEWIRKRGLLPNPMRYQPLRTLLKNAYVPPGWTDYELRRMTRYYSRLKFGLEAIPYDEFKGSGDPHQLELIRRA